MGKYSLTTTAKEVVASEEEDRCYLFSAGLFSTASVVYLRYGSAGNPFLILSSAGTTAIRAKVPGGKTVEAYTDAGTAELCTLRVDK